MLIKKKGFIEFGWIFALIVGALILFLAFYFVGTKLTESKQGKALISENNFDILLNPFSYFGSLGASASKEISLQKKDRLNFSCVYDGSLGYNGILSAGDKSTANFLAPKKVYDKYLFAENSIESKRFQIISKPFSLPWRVADLIYVFSKERVYCFVGLSNMGDEFGPEGTGMNITNFVFEQKKEKCPADSVRVCSTSMANDCSVNIHLTEGYLIKQGSGNRFYFIDDATMYAAIFSSYENYNCNLKRLAQRIKYESDVYKIKVDSLNQRGCDPIFSLDQINAAADRVIAADSSSKLASALAFWKTASDTLNNQNANSDCSLY